MKSHLSLSQYLIEEQLKLPGATGDFTALMSHLVYAAKVVASEVRRAGLQENILGATENTNVQGETQQKLDEYADEIFIETLGKCGHLCAFASEERDGMIHIPKGYTIGNYTIAFDPLDGSSNIDSNVSIGTIFSIHMRVSEKGKQGEEKDLLQAGSKQRCAGYILYGTSTMMVLSFGNGVVGFTLDPSCGEFLLSHPSMKTPEVGAYYSINEGNYHTWNSQVQNYINYLKSDEGKKPKSSRYIGSLVADFHRNMLKGGIFLYPNDTKSSQYPDGKLRMLYEAAPIAFLAEQAGGMAVNAKGERILDIVPKGLHERTTLVVGSKKDVEEYIRMTN